MEALRVAIWLRDSGFAGKAGAPAATPGTAAVAVGIAAVAVVVGAAAAYIVNSKSRTSVDYVIIPNVVVPFAFSQGLGGEAMANSYLDVANTPPPPTVLSSLRANKYPCFLRFAQSMLILVALSALSNDDENVAGLFLSFEQARAVNSRIYEDYRF